MSNSVPLSRNNQSMKVATYGENLFGPRGSPHSDPSCPKRSDALNVLMSDSCPYQEQCGRKPMYSGTSRLCLLPPSVLSDCSSHSTAGIINILPLWGVVLQQE